MKLVAILSFLVLCALCVFGWVSNIVQIIAIANLPITGMFIVKCIGIFVAPLGVVLGWIG